ncbi:MAG: hypothetical protein HY834_14795 [Devosia nanyangense]|uniref:RepB-like DNA primase domain-containing protein n=1 Tax=Devosia nanyangense TaxID=1228055 RepID=A0A933L4R7_9HYPH|nr:hypothetical protein [Devosia nanyangense]
MVLDPETGDVEAATFTDPVKAGAWIGVRNGKKNLYLAGLNPAPKPTGWKGRALKTDVPFVVGRHLDLDLDKFEAGHPWFALSLEQRKAKKVEELHAFKDPGPPSVIVDTGGGLQCYWLLDTPEPVTPDLLPERANEHLIAVLGGDPGTFEVNRPLRLPGTTNLPDAKKRARGRVVAEAKLLEFNDRRYADWEFELAPPRPKDTSVDVEIGEAEPVEDLAWLFEQYHVPERVQRIVREGPLPDYPKAKDNSLSAWVLDAACALVRCRVPNAQIVAVLVDEELGIGRADERQAYRAVKKANRLVATEREFDDEFQQRLDAAPIVDDSEKRRDAPIVDDSEKRRNAPIVEGGPKR